MTVLILMQPIPGLAPASFYNGQVRSWAAPAERQGWRRALSACLLLWHLCSLDAPTVAVVWAVTLARLVNAPFGLVEGLVLALGTWIVYVLDRVLDGLPDEPQSGAEDPLTGIRFSCRMERRLQDRHIFHARHRSPLLGLCGAAGILLAVLCCRLPTRLVGFYLGLGLPVAAYSLRVHARFYKPPRHARRDAPKSGGRSKQFNGMAKEAAVAILFTAAVTAPAWTSAPDGNRAALGIPALLLTGLCWLNCSLISHVEASVSADPRLPDSLRKRFQLSSLAMALLLAASTTCSFERSWRGAAWPASAATLLSCLLLLGLLLSLGVRDTSLAEARRLRVLADVALLTPLLFLFPR